MFLTMSYLISLGTMITIEEIDAAMTIGTTIAEEAAVATETTEGVVAAAEPIDRAFISSELSMTN